MMPSLPKPAFWLTLLITISILLICALFFDWLPFLRGGYGWRWPYAPPSLATVRNILPGVIALTIYLVGLRWAREWKTAVYLLWVFLGAIAIPVALLTIIADSPFYLLYTRTVSWLSTGAYLKAAEYNSLSNLIQQWPNEVVMQTAPTHISVSPPGWPALYVLTAKLFDLFPPLADSASSILRPLQCDNLTIMNRTNAQIASAWFGILSPLWGACTILPLYFLGRELSGATAVRKAIAWWPLIPSFSVFLATLSNLYPLLASTTLMFFVLGLCRRRTHPKLAQSSLVLSGIIAALCLMINFTFVPLLLLCALFTWLHQPEENLLKGEVKWLDKIFIGILFAAGLILALVIYRLVAGYHFHSLLPLAMNQHLELERPYLPWLWLHSWDVILFAGLPIFGLYMFSLWHLPLNRSRRFGLSLALTLLILVLSGTARGETGRIWMLFMPLLLLPIGNLFTYAYRGWERAFLAVQIAWLIVIVAVIPAVGTGLPEPPQYAHIAPPPLTNSPFIPAPSNFEDKLQLVGFQGIYQPQTNSILLDLAWQVPRRPATSYLFAILAVDPKGSVQSVKEWLPLDYRFPTTCWQPEIGTIHDQINIELNRHPVAGEWWFSLSAFVMGDDQSPHYLTVTLPTGEVDQQQIGLGPITVSP